MKNTQLVLIEYYNTEPFLERFTSLNKIKIEEVARFLQKRDGFDEDEDCITFIEEPKKDINLD